MKFKKILLSIFITVVTLGISNQAMAWGTANTIGGTTYYNFGGRTGTSSTIGGTTYFDGDLFRGQPDTANCGSFRGWTSTPNGFGGYNFSNGNGQFITSTPNGFGGYNYSGSNGMFGSSTPNGFGGYNYSGNMFRGQTDTVNCGSFRGWTSTPNGFGGYNFSNGNGQFITSTPNGFGGYNYSGSNGMFGSSTPNGFGGYNYSGNMFRGQPDTVNCDGFRGALYRDTFGDIRDTGDVFFRIPSSSFNSFRGQSIPTSKSIFANEVFQGKIDEGAIRTAIQMRNINALLSSAWDLKGFETISNVKDDNLNSAMLFDLAAQFAVDQENADALKSVIELAPECKKYDEQLALRSQTRGTHRSSCKTAFPELVYLQPNSWQSMLKGGLKEWQQPVADFYLCGMFRGMTEPAAFHAGNLVNSGRINMNPIMLATGAMELSFYDYTKDFSPWFEPGAIFAEAVEMAVALNDKSALEEIAGMYEKANFKNPEYASYITDQIAMLANTRGMQASEDHPGSFSMSDIRNLIKVQF